MNVVLTQQKPQPMWSAVKTGKANRWVLNGPDGEKSGELSCCRAGEVEDIVDTLNAGLGVQRVRCADVPVGHVYTDGNSRYLAVTDTCGMFLDTLEIIDYDDPDALYQDLGPATILVGNGKVDGPWEAGGERLLLHNCRMAVFMHDIEPLVRAEIANKLNLAEAVMR